MIPLKWITIKTLVEPNFWVGFSFIKGLFNILCCKLFRKKMFLESVNYQILCFTVRGRLPHVPIPKNHFI